MFYPSDLNLDNEHLNRVTVLAGEFSQNPAISNWESATKVNFIPASGDYLPDWTELLASVQKDQNPGR